MNERPTFRPQTFRKPPVKVVGQQLGDRARTGPNPDIKPREVINRYIRRALIAFVFMGAVIFASIKGLQAYWRKVDQRLQSPPPAARPITELPSRPAEAVAVEFIDDETEEVADVEATSPTVADPTELSDEPVAKALFLSRRAKALEADGNIHDAILLYEDALFINPDLHLIHGQVGRLYLLTGRYDEAILSLSRALASAPEAADLMNDLGTAYLNAGDAAMALDAFEAALTLDPTLLQAHFNAGLAAIELRQVDLARQSLLTYRGAFPEDPRVFRELARLSTMERDLDQAIALLDEAIALDPEWTVPLLDAARLLAARGQALEALGYLDRALDLTSPVIIYQLYQQPNFRDARMTETGRAFEQRLARLAREQLFEPTADE